MLILKANDADKWFVKNSIRIKTYWKLQFKENIKFERCFRSNPSMLLKLKLQIENMSIAFLINVQHDIECPYMARQIIFYIFNVTMLSLEYDICY